MSTLTLTLTHETDRGFFCEEFPNAIGTTVDNTVAEAILAAMVFSGDMSPPAVVMVGGFQRDNVKTNRVKYLLQQKHASITGSAMDMDFEVKISR
jgi:hypothetical protein